MWRASTSFGIPTMQTGLFSDLTCTR
jgi:hypothetical protein